MKVSNASWIRLTGIWKKAKLGEAAGDNFGKIIFEKFKWVAAKMSGKLEILTKSLNF